MWVPSLMRAYIAFEKFSNSPFRPNNALAYMAKIL